MDLHCGKCKETFVRNDLKVQCKGVCAGVFHAKCFDLAEYDIRVINTKKNIVCICDECQEHITLLEKKMQNLLTVVNENKNFLIKQEVEIKEVLKQLKNMNEKENSGKHIQMDQTVEETYALVVKKVPPIIIKPKEKQEPKITKEAIKNSVNPTELSIKINSVKNKNNGVVVIGCDSEVSSKKMENALKTKMGENYSIHPGTLKDPKLIIRGLKKQYTDEDLYEMLKNQNDIDSGIKIIKLFESKKVKNRYNAIIQVEKTIYDKIIKEGKLNMGWEKCAVYEYTNVKRCFKCWGYNHEAKECRNKKVCPKCAEEHEEKECNNTQTKCVNCLSANLRLRLNLDINHDSRDKHCEVFKQKIEVEKQKIDL